MAQNRHGCIWFVGDQQSLLTSIHEDVRENIGEIVRAIADNSGGVAGILRKAEFDLELAGSIYGLRH